MNAWLWFGSGIASGVLLVVACLVGAFIWYARQLTKAERLIAVSAATIPDTLRERAAAVHAAAQSAERALRSGASAHQIVAGLYVAAASAEQRAAAVARKVAEA